MLRAACSTRPRLASNYQCEPLIYRARCVGSKFTVSFHVLAVRRSLTVINLCRSHESIHFVRCSSFGPRHFVSNVKLSLICLLATFIRDIVSMNGARSVHDYTNCRRVEVQSTWKSHTIFLCSKTVHLRDNRITNDIHVYILFKQHSATSLLFLFFLLQKKNRQISTPEWFFPRSLRRLTALKYEPISCDMRAVAAMAAMVESLRANLCAAIRRSISSDVGFSAVSLQFFASLLFLFFCCIWRLIVKVNTPHHTFG